MIVQFQAKLTEWEPNDKIIALDDAGRLWVLEDPFNNDQWEELASPPGASGGATTTGAPTQEISAQQQADMEAAISKADVLLHQSK